MEEIVKKPCKRCKEPKILEEFPLHGKFKDGHNTVCKECKRIEGRDFYKENKSAILKKQRGRNRGRWPIIKLRQYNMTVDEYRSMLSKQAGRCAICGSLPKENQSLYVDHNHETGQVRGLLCSHCNFMLGHAKDTPKILLNGVKYLLERDKALKSEGC